MLRLEGLGKKFGALVVPDDLTFEVRPNELHAVIGPNGAGKTTLINQISGLIASDGGRILLDGRDITALPPHARASLGIARTYQITSVIPSFTVLQNVALAAQAKDGSSFRFFGRVDDEAALNAKARAALGDLGLADRAQRLAGELSHGEKRVLELAMALVSEPKL